MKGWIVLLAVAFAMTAAAQEPQYTYDPGPSILSRGTGALIEGGGDLMQLRPYVSINAIYDTALTPFSVDASGSIPKYNAYGGEAGFGLVGYRRFQRIVLGIDYRGSVRKYGRRSAYDGSDHTMSVGLTYRLSPRTSFTLRQAAGTYSQNFGFTSGYEFFDPSFGGVPANELFNSRIYYLSPMGDLTFSPSPRLSFNIGASGSFIRRQAGLGSSLGWSARGDVSYRIDRRVSIGLDYNFRHYEFSNSLGASDLHSAAFDVSFLMGRHWELSVRAGAARAETSGLRRIALDPILAALFGQDFVFLNFYSKNYIPSAEAQLRRVFRRSVLSFGYGMGADPGNGIYLMSRSQHGGAGYSYTARRNLNLGISADYTAYSSFSNDLGRYASYSSGGGVTYRLVEWLHWTADYRVRRYDIGSGTLRRLDQRVSIGLALSPGELPLPLW